jgi:tetratricopeptide (TPR) repeat protein
LSVLTAVLLSAFPVLTCAKRTPPTVAPAVDADASNAAVVRFLEQRVANDPGDSVAWNRLGNLYLRLLRLTGNHAFLDQASRAAEASLRAVPAEANRGALALLIRARAGGHQFAAARDLSRQLLVVQPDSAEPWELLGDALLELGEYDEAGDAYEKAQSFGSTVSAESRLGRLAWLHGDVERARSRFEAALARARQSGDNDPEPVAWCLWQLGDLAFATGGNGVARQRYEEALATFPRSIPTIGALARLDAAEGRIDRAMSGYEKAIALDPVPLFLAALADLHDARGNARRIEDLFHRIDLGASDERDRRLDRRQLANLWADHDMRAEEAYALAAADAAERNDIYAADTLAWSALKSGRLPEAQRAIASAMRLGTRDAKLYYHAGMIAAAAGDDPAARKYLREALSLNPGFDFLQAKIARRTLQQLER